MKMIRLWLLCLLLSVPLCARQAVSITLIGNKWQASGSYLTCFEIKNTSSEVFGFSGYSDDSPIYRCELLKFGRWHPERMGWCGVGMGQHDFPPGKTFPLDTLPPKGSRPWRIALPVRSTTPDGKTAEPLFYSAPIPPFKSADITRHRSPPVQGGVKLGVAYHEGLPYPCEFTLTNLSSAVLYYGGFKEKHVPPIYLGQEHIHKKWSEEHSVDWSGTGLGFQILSPLESITFRIPAQSLEHPWRIGIRLFRTDKPSALHDAYVPVWWPRLPKRGVTPDPIPGPIFGSLIEASTPPPQ